VKTPFRSTGYVCLMIALIIGAVAVNLPAQVGPGNGTYGQDPGPQQLPATPANYITCSSSNNPNHVLDAAASNPHNAPTSDIPLPLPNLSQNQLDLFCAALGVFQQFISVDGVIANAGGAGNTGNCTPADLPPGSSGTIPCDETGTGLGPRFNGNSCVMCHSNPNFLSASGPINPEDSGVPLLGIPSGGVGVLDGATNSLSAFGSDISPTGPVREVRFINLPGTNITDGTVHDLFTITGRVDATNAININPSLGLTTCAEQQPNFGPNIASNIIFRIPIIATGDGLVELLDDYSLMDNNQASSGYNGVAGTFNRSPNTFNISRFGWKAQNPSLSVFSGEASDVEMGVTNDLFPNERRLDDTLLGYSLTTLEDCQFHILPDDFINFVMGSSNSNEGNLASEISTRAFNFSAAMRLSAPPQRLPENTNAQAGAALFVQIGCNQCHSNNSTGDLVTIASSSFPVGQGLQPVLAFSDFALHAMASGPGLTNTYGQPCLDDSIAQGLAAGNMFRTAPLWGTSTRIFFLHDGRDTYLGDVILNHICSGSEANVSAQAFAGLSPAQQNDIIDYLRTL